MKSPLTGRLILIAEDEPLIAFEIAQAFEAEGARVIATGNLTRALVGVEDPDLSAAILDHALSDCDSTMVCARMKERNIPFVTYSGYDQVGDRYREGVHVKKPQTSCPCWWRPSNTCSGSASVGRRRARATCATA